MGGDGKTAAWQKEQWVLTASYRRGLGFCFFSQDQLGSMGFVLLSGAGSQSSLQCPQPGLQLISAAQL